MQRYRYFIAMIVVLLLAGCSSTTAAKTAATTAVPSATQTQAPYTCPVNVLSVRLTVGTNGVVCPSQFIDAQQAQGGYGQALYILPPSGTVHVATRGGSNRLVLLSVQYLEVLDNGTQRTVVVYFQPTTSYDVASMSCMGPAGQNVSAQPESLFAYVPEQPGLNPALLASGSLVGGNGVIDALDPSFGLKSFSELADALCAL